MKRLTPFAKLLIVVGLVGGLFGALKVAERTGVLDKVIPAGKVPQNVAKGTFNFGKKVSTEKLLRVGVVTWGGYAGGQYFNGGFKASENSRYYKDYGLQVEFVVIDDYNASRDAFKSGAIDVLWTTVDSFPTEVESMKDLNPKLIFQADWSRGGDALVVRRGIANVADLRGKKVAVAFGTPSHTFLLWLLDAGDISYQDIQVVQAPSAIDAAAYFKAGKVDAAVVWSPDDEDCRKSVQGATILKSTRQASNIIADAFYVRAELLDQRRDDLKALVEGWLKGAAEINTDTHAKAEAVRILAEGLQQPADFCENAINNARLATYGDNVNFFNLRGNATGVKGEDIYNAMSIAYNKVNLAPAQVPAWRQVVDTSLLGSINLAGLEHQAEGGVRFAQASAAERNAPAFSTKRVTITFNVGSAVLDENAKYVVQAKFGDIAKSFANARIRIEGNTDITGSESLNQKLSQARAQSVATFLVKEYRFDPNRFVVKGNGSGKPVADNESVEGRSKNRRTDFEIIN